MAITRTAMVDDDGSGTTGTIINNAWKTELYNQIDAFLSGHDSLQIWTPIDASGAGLVFTGVAARYVTVGKLIVFVASLTYPANANGAAGKIGGLPTAAATVGTLGGGAVWAFPMSAGAVFGLIRSGTTVVELFKQSGVGYTNTELQNVAHYIFGLYFRP